MPRKSPRKKPDWTPSPECETAYANAIETAHLAAASLLGEKPVDDPGRDASAAALMLAMAMVFFLVRLDPRDGGALYRGPGSFADFDYKPFDRSRWPKKSFFAAFLDA